MKPELPPRPMTPDEIEAFRRDGAVCLRGLYSPKWVAKLETAFDAILARPTFEMPGVSKSFRVDGYAWLRDDAVRDFVLQGPSAHVVQQVFGAGKVNFYNDAIFAKLELTPDPTPWHHDTTFWPFEGWQIASLWTSVDAVDAESSALELIPGSHLWDKRWKPVATGGVVMSTEPLESLPDIDADRSRYNILCWDLEPGDAILFHARTVHGARGNASPHKKRRAITTRWFGDDVVYRPTGQAIPPWRHNLQPGDSVSGSLFPQVLPQWDVEALAERMKGPVLPDPELAARAFEQLAKLERVPVKI